MRLVEGTDLGRLLEGDEALEPARAAQLIGQLAEALDAADARGLVHRDVKPANVLLTLDRPEHLYLTDFGVANNVGEGGGAGQGGSMTAADGRAGTIDYLAPEQIRGEQVGAGVCIDALGGLLYHCLTGKVPFPRDSEAAKLWAHVNAAPPVPSRVRPGLPTALDQVIARGGWRRTPAKRFQMGCELARACARALGVEVEESNGGASATG